MKNGKKCVLVTNAGGGLAQGVLRLLRSLGYPVRSVAVGESAVSGANHLCERVYAKGINSSKDRHFVDVDFFQEICALEGVDLIIPCTDHECFYLQQAKELLPNISCSPEATSLIFYDKYLTWQKLNEANIPFAPSCLPSNYEAQFGQTVVKPRTGRLSEDLHINPPDIAIFSDNYIVQPFIEGPELTTAFYVTKPNEILGQITFVRFLRQGSTFECEVTSEYDSQIREIIERLVNTCDIKGPCNFQSRVQNGVVIPFEVNCRISGTCSIRAQFGFEDVRYIVEEHLFERTPSKPLIRYGCATRVILDVIYPNKNFSDVEKGSISPYYIF